MGQEANGEHGGQQGQGLSLLCLWPAPSHTRPLVSSFLLPAQQRQREDQGRQRWRAQVGVPGQGGAHGARRVLTTGCGCWDGPCRRLSHGLSWRSQHQVLAGRGSEGQGGIRVGWAVAGPSDFHSLLPLFSVLIPLPLPCSAPTTESGLRCPCVGGWEVKGVGRLKKPMTAFRVKAGLDRWT